jgi:hypothetical protein
LSDFDPLIARRMMNMDRQYGMTVHSSCEGRLRAEQSPWRWGPGSYALNDPARLDQRRHRYQPKRMRSAAPSSGTDILIAQEHNMLEIPEVEDRIPNWKIPNPKDQSQPGRRAHRRPISLALSRHHAAPRLIDRDADTGSTGDLAPLERGTRSAAANAVAAGDMALARRAGTT